MHQHKIKSMSENDQEMSLSQFTDQPMAQGSHKLWKTWKITKKSYMHGKSWNLKKN